MTDSVAWKLMLNQVREERDALKAALRLNYDFLTKTLGYDSHDFLVQSTERALGIPTLETSEKPFISEEALRVQYGVTPANRGGKHGT
jgi:hypothetical protein